MKRVIYVNLVFLLVAGVFCSAGYCAPWAGKGTAKNPYKIHTAEDMQAIGADANYWDAHFKLMADIDLGSYTGTSFNIIGKYVGYNDPENMPFTGVFNGGGHTILNFTYDSNEVGGIGIFGFINDPNAEVKNVGLTAPDVNAGSGSRVGALVGRLYNGTVSVCYVEGGNVTGRNAVGGLIGHNDEGDTQNSYSTGRVAGERAVGGLVGSNYKGYIFSSYSISGVTGEEYVGGLVGLNKRRGDIQDCYSTCSVTGERAVGGLVGCNKEGCIQESCSAGTITGRYYIGGLVGLNGYGDIKESYSTSRVIGEKSVGGLVGCNEGTIQESYSRGKVAGEINVGGLVGWNCYGHVTRSYSKGEVIGGEEYVGGLVGDNWHGKIEGCYSKGAVIGQNGVGGLVGSNCGLGSNFLLGQIRNSYSTGGVAGEKRVGGLVGENWSGHIQDSYSIACVTGELGVGGLVGDNHGDITSCYSKGGVAGGRRVGGMAGINYDDIQDSYSTGEVVGEEDVGGLVGYGSSSYVTDSFWDVNSSGMETSDGGTGLPTVDMQMESTFTDEGWDFVGEVINGTEDIWQMCDLPDYPRLAWEICPIEVEMDFVPEMLNCESKGDWVEAHFVLPEGYWGEDVDVNSPAVAEPIGAVSEAIEVLDEGDGNYGIVAVFDREAFCEAVGGDVEKELEITVKGAFTDGVEFYGTDTIKLISDHWQHRNSKD